MQIGVIEAPTVKELFIQRMAEMIIKGELKPGDRLPSERELAQQSRISKSAVHLALSDLERMGFVETNARHGTYVADYSRRGNAETMNLLLRFNGGAFDEKHTHDLLEMRMALEGTAIDRLSREWNEDTEKLLSDDLAKSQAIVQEKGSTADLAASFFHFHHDICVASGNFILPLIFNTFEYVTQAYWQQAIIVLGEEKCLSLETEFYELLKKKDPEKSKAYLKKEFQMFTNTVRKK